MDATEADSAVQPAPSTGDSQTYASVVKDKYEGTWGAALGRIEAHIAQGHELPTILARLGRLKFPGVRDSFWRKQSDAGAATRAVHRLFGMPEPDASGDYVRVVGGRYFPSSGYNPIAEIGAHIQATTTVVVELGSGWSANLFQVYIWTGTPRARGIKFVGAEYTDGGREAASRLAEHEGRIAFSSVHFDWTKPDLSWLAEIEGPKHVLAFSHHSIEQVPEIDPEVYAQLARYADSATVLHYEPVAWQQDPLALAKRREGRAPYFRRIRRALVAAGKGESTDLDLGTLEGQRKVASWWSFARNHNHNLLEVARNSPHVEVVSTLFDFDSVSNPLNPSSLVELKVNCTK